MAELERKAAALAAETARLEGDRTRILESLAEQHRYLAEVEAQMQASRQNRSQMEVEVERHASSARQKRALSRPYGVGEASATANL